MYWDLRDKMMLEEIQKDIEPWMKGRFKFLNQKKSSKGSKILLTDVNSDIFLIEWPSELFSINKNVWFQKDY